MDRSAQHNLGGGTGSPTIWPRGHLRPLSARRTEVQEQGWTFRSLPALSSPTLSFLRLFCLFNICSIYLKCPPPPIPYLPASLPQQVPVSDSPPPRLTGPWKRQLIRLGNAATHFSLRFGCSASSPHLHTQHAPFVYLYLFAPPPHPPDDSMAQLSRVVMSFLCKPFRFPRRLFVCLLNKADSNWKLSVFTIPEWRLRCVHTSTHNQDRIHASRSPPLPRCGGTE